MKPVVRVTRIVGEMTVVLRATSVMSAMRKQPTRLTMSVPYGKPAPKNLPAQSPTK
jgi:hypothetical protein